MDCRSTACITRTRCPAAAGSRPRGTGHAAPADSGRSHPAATLRAAIRRVLGPPAEHRARRGGDAAGWRRRCVLARRTCLCGFVLLPPPFFADMRWSRRWTEIPAGGWKAGPQGEPRAKSHTVERTAQRPTPFVACACQIAARGSALRCSLTALQPHSCSLTESHPWAQSGLSDALDAGGDFADAVDAAAAVDGRRDGLAGITAGHHSLP